MNHCMDVHPPSEMCSKDRGVYVKNYRGMFVFARTSVRV